MNVFVASGDVQDRDAAIPLLCRTRRLFPFIERIFADGGYQGEKTANAVAKTGAWTLEIVKRSDLHRFVVLPKRWIVERTFAWISRNRRLARDFERHARKAAALLSHSERRFGFAKGREGLCKDPLVDVRTRARTLC